MLNTSTMLNPPPPPQKQQEQYLNGDNFASFFQSINPAINPFLNDYFPQPILSSGFLSGSNGKDFTHEAGLKGENASLKSQIVAELGDCSSNNIGATVIHPVGDKLAISSRSCKIPVIEDPNMVPEKTKLSQLVCCEICSIDFNSNAVYTSHMSGKRHKKKVEMLNSINTTGGGAVDESVTLAFPEGLQTKVHESIEGSSKVVFMRICTLCNVECNTQKIFDQHIVGKKHIAQARKMAQDVKELSVAANPNSISGGGPAGISQIYATSNHDKSHVDQFAWCQVCNISCTSKDVLNIHQQGKKHMKNMKKVNTISSDLLIGQMEVFSLAKGDESNSDNINEGSKLFDSAPDKSSTVGPDDMKECGSEGYSKNKGTNKIASCDVCDIYCTSEDLLAIHKLGRKHLKKLEKLNIETKSNSSTPINAPYSTVPEKSRIMGESFVGFKPYSAPFFSNSRIVHRPIKINYFKIGLTILE